MTAAGSEEHRRLIGKGGKMSKLDVVIKQRESEVEEQEIILIEKGMPPARAHEVAINIVSTRRSDEYADKSGG